MRVHLRTLVAMTAVGPPTLAALWFGDVMGAYLIVVLSYVFLSDWLSGKPISNQTTIGISPR